MSDAQNLPLIVPGAYADVRRLPLVPEIKLYLLQDDYPTHGLDEENYRRLMANPPYWAFCWGGGQALARWILDNPGFVAGRKVVDFGAGSGVAGIAAALAGATSVLAVDIDEDALRVCIKNAQLNRVKLDVALSCESGQESLMLAADVCYEDEGFARVVSHLQGGGDVLLAESRLRDLSSRFSQLQKLAHYSTRTYPDLDESDRYDQVDLYTTYFV